MINQENGIYRITARSSLADGVMILLFIFGGLILYVGFSEKEFFLNEGYSEQGVWGIIGAGAACIVAGVLLLTVFKFKKLVAEISEEGIVERASKVSKGLIRWEEIESVRVFEIENANALSNIGGRKNKGITVETKFVGIYLVDPDAYAGKLNIVQKGIMKAGLKMGYAPISIPFNLLYDVEEFVNICNRFARKNKVDK